jgi:hypothetical protein
LDCIFRLEIGLLEEFISDSFLINVFLIFVPYAIITTYAYKKDLYNI